MTKRLGTILAGLPTWAQRGLFYIMMWTCRRFPRAMNRHRAIHLAYLAIPTSVAARTQSGITLVATSKDIIEFLLFGDMEPDNTRFFTSVVPHVHAVIDVGAHLGYYVVLAGHLLPNQGEVLALEPMPATYAGLVKNIQANDLKNVRAENLAVFSKKTELTLRIPSNATFPGGTMTDSFYKDGMQDVTVQAVALDDFYPEILEHKKAIILIDIEGSEHDALQGMKRTLASAKPLVLLELHPAMLASMGIDCRDTMDILYNLGYRCLALGQGGKRLEEFDLSDCAQGGGMLRWVVGIPDGNTEWVDIFTRARIELPASFVTT